MFRHSRFIFPSVVLLFILLFSMARPMAVYADDSTPPPPATQEPTDPPTEEAPVVAESETATSEVPTSLSTEPEALTVSEILEVAPEGTQVVVLDETGSAMPLVSVDAAEVVATADPMWCPAGALPGGAGCTTNFASPQALIDDIDNSNPNSTNSIYEQDGIIYFTTDPGGNFILTPGSGNALQTADYDVLKVFNLTLQGGWNGLNDGSGFTLSGQTDFDSNRVQIGSSGNPWVGNITLNNISIDGVSNAGLTVYTDGNINLSDVSSQNNAGNGARLDNNSGNGVVTVQNSSFNDNTGNGLRVLSNRDITLVNVIANENGDSGAYLDNTFGSGSISVGASLAGGSSFSGNGVDGLEANSNNDITVNNVVANNNTEIGGSLINETGEGNVFVSNSTFDSNTSTGQDAGLEIVAGGDVTLDSVSASNNSNGNGGSISGSSLLIQNSIFNNNSSSTRGWGRGLDAEADQAEIICSQFMDNRTYGIDGSNLGTLTLDDVTFSGNLSGNYTGSAIITSGGCESSGGDGSGGNEGGGGDPGGGGEGVGNGVNTGGGNPSATNSLPQNFVLITGLPLHIVAVNGREKIKLDCKSFSGTKLILPNGDHIIVPCPIDDQASLGQYEQVELPGKLKSKYHFLSDMDAEVMGAGQFVSVLDTNMIIDFVIPKGQLKSNLAILHWEGMHWVEVRGGHITSDGYFEATTSLTGIFVLVSK